MNLELSVILVVAALLVLLFVLRHVRHAGLEVTDSIFWIGLAILITLVALFPPLAYRVSAFLGFDAPSNCIFFFGMLLLLIRTFTQDQKICVLKKKLTRLVQAEALRDHLGDKSPDTGE